MSKRIHLICNAHIDPVWQWEWEEGAAEALSTFRIAADFCEEYDGFVFCHNEALLYQWVEEYDNALFKRIQELVKAGKWHIMGGWFLQPDCNMPSGEFMIRQIVAGKRYFKEKFGVCPEVAVNVDPFGHDRGLVQIMVKCGYKGYLFMRPDESWLSLPAGEFTWQGYDGSQITGIRINQGYNSGKGKAAQKILDRIANCPEDDIGLCLWGIGNHGGGPSKKDLDDISELVKKLSASGDELIHSTPEKYLEAIKDCRELPLVDKSLRPWAIGCYTSQIRIKQKYRKAEGMYFVTESMAANAAACGLCDYPEEELAKALYDIIFVQFHDMLPGSSIQPAEEMGIRMLDHAIEILSRIKARMFFALSRGHKKPKSDKIPIFVYNPYPYEIKNDITAEFMLWDQEWDRIFMQPHLYDENDIESPCQCEKEYSTIPLQWRKRVLFNATLPPMSVSCFSCGFERMNEKPVLMPIECENYYIANIGDTIVKINRETGLIDSLKHGSIEYLKENSLALTVYKDNYDPWFMTDTSIKEQIGDFKLLTPKQAAEFCCVESELEAVRLIESGEVRLVFEALFGYNSSRAVVKYIISANGSLKTEIRVIWNEKQKLIRLKVPAALKSCSAYGEQMFGREKLNGDNTENVSQKFIVLADDKNGILCANNGVYGSMFDDHTGVLAVTLMRSASYCAHPLEGRETMPQDRYMPYIEQGERDFEFLFEFSDKEYILEHAARISTEFNAPAFAYSFYNSDNDNKPEAPLSISDDRITTTAFKRADSGKGYIVRLFNPTEKEMSAVLRFKKTEKDINFGAYEFKTMYCTDCFIEETTTLEN